LDPNNALIPRICGADMHILIYIGLGLAYIEAALDSFAKRERHSAFREIVIACLYIAAAFAVWIISPQRKQEDYRLHRLWPCLL